MKAWLRLLFPPDGCAWLWALLLLACLCGTCLALGFDGLYGQDAYAHLNYARAIQAHWREGIPLGPYQWPRLYAFLGALWPWGDPRGWMQFLSMAGAAALLGFLLKLLRAAQPGARWLSPLAFAFVGLSPFFLRNALTVMADTPSLGALAGALWWGHGYSQGGGRGRLALAAAAGGCAVMLRYPAALALAPAALSWLLAAHRRGDWLACALALPCLALAALPQLLLPQAAGEGLSQPFQHQHFLQWRLEHAVQRDFLQQDGYNAYATPNLLAALGLLWHPRYLGLGCLGTVAWAFRRRLALPRASWWAVGAIALSTAFLAGIPYQNPRFLLPCLPFAALLLAPGWTVLWERLPRAPWLRWAGYGLLLTAQLGMVAWSCRLPLQVNATEREIASHLSQLPQRGQRLYELGFEAMLQARGVPLEEVNMWEGPLPPPRAGDLVLFNPGRFAPQFAGMWPMRNWDMLHQGHVLKLQHRWKEGWELHVIH